MSKCASGLFSGTRGDRSFGIVRRIIPGTEGVVTGGSSSKLGRNMLRKMNVNGAASWSGYQAQHIIPAQMSDHPVLKKIGMNLDDASNGIFLRTPGNGISTQARHRGFHKVYSDFVRGELDRIGTSGDSLSIQRQVRSLQNKLRKLQSSGLPLYSAEGATVELWKRYMNKLK